MRKKVGIDALQIGMYVDGLDCPWVGTPFLYQGFEITTEKQIATLRRLCQFVYVSEKPTLASPVAKRAVAERMATPVARRGAVTRPARESDLTRVLGDNPRATRWQPELTSFEEELGQAREIETETRAAIYTILDDVRLGRSLRSAAAKEVVAEMVESVIRNPDAMVVLSQLKDADQYTALHSLRVCILALTFGRHLDMSREELNLLGVGALLHDVGKMKVPSEVLNKPGKLTDEEFAIIQSHVPAGIEIVSKSAGIAALSLEVVAHHHERYGGGGYVLGLSGDAIRPFGLMAAICDCYDAITSDRVYRAGMPPHQALTKMYEWRTTDFHPGLVEQFIQCMGIYPIGSVVELDNGAVGVVVTVNRERRLKPRIALVLDPAKQPYPAVRLLDLMREALENPHKPLEIKKVLPSGAHGIEPAHYLSVDF